MSAEEAVQPQRVEPGPEVSPEDLAPGTEVNGYRLVRFVNKGGYGAVWLAESVWDPACRVALKFNQPPPGTLAGEERAVKEVQLLLQAVHPNVLGVLGYGRWKHWHYTVLKWVEGDTALEWTRAHNPTLRQVVNQWQKVVLALQAVHERGVVHRDFKPGNLLVRDVDGEPFLADFGVGYAKGSPTLTRASTPPGTPDYRSPEVLAHVLRASGLPYRFRPADDWYAVGVSLYAVLTEVLPFPGGEESGWSAEEVLRRRPVPPHVLNPRVPLPLSRVVMRMLAKRPRQRYRDGYALWEALDKALRQRVSWDVPIYEPGPPRAPGQTPTEPATPSDGYVAEDLELLFAREQKRATPFEEQRLVAVLSLRGALLPHQPLEWPRAVRHGAAVMALLLMAVAVWAAWPSALREQSPTPGPGMAGAALAGLMEEALTAPELLPVETLDFDTRESAVSLEMPPRAFPGQRLAPCDEEGATVEIALRNGQRACWVKVDMSAKACKTRGYEWKGGCYLPWVPAPRAPSSVTPRMPPAPAERAR